MAYRDEIKFTGEIKYLDPKTHNPSCNIVTCRAFDGRRSMIISYGEYIDQFKPPFVEMFWGPNYIPDSYNTNSYSRKYNVQRNTVRGLIPWKYNTIVEMLKQKHREHFK